MALQLAFVLVAIIIGARLGGIGLGVMGGIGLAILTFGFGLQPTSPPIDVMLMIAAVISAASCMQAVIAIFGIAWMGDTFLQGNMLQLTQSVEGVVRQMPWLFGIALFAMSILLYSQAATVRALMPLGIALGISPMILVALFPAVNGYFFIPNYPTVVAAINFDRTGTTRIGKYVLNHSFMLPGLVSTGVAIGLGLLFIRIF